MAAPKKISLLPQEGFEFTTLGRIVTWSLSAGRIIVVVTELIVITAFLSRFWLDRNLTDLNDKIAEQQALIKTYQKFETEWVKAQEKLQKVSELSQNSIPMDKDLKAVTGVIPPNIAVSQLTMDTSTVQISGLTAFEGAVDNLIGNLNSLNIGSVELTNLTVSPGEQLGTKFTIVITRQKP